MAETRASYVAGPRPKRKSPEKDFQQDLCQWLALAVPRAQVYQFGKPGGRPRCSNCGTVVGRLAGSAPTGWPDLLIVIPRAAEITKQGLWVSRPLYIHLELKAGKNGLTDSELSMRVALLGVGAAAYTVYSIRDVYTLLVANGIRPRLEAP